MEFLILQTELKLWYGVTEVASMLGFHRQTVLSWINKRKLPAVKIRESRAGKYKILHDDLKRFVETEFGYVIIIGRPTDGI